MIDRKYNFRKVCPIIDDAHVEPQPARENGGYRLRNVFDGELVIDKKWRRGNESDHPIFLIFDVLIVNKKNLMPLTFTQRLKEGNAYIQNRFTKARLLRKVVENKEKVPIVDVFMKEMFNIWDAHVIFSLIKDKLEHENDGIIFTVDAAPYYMGVCPHILKWKPLHLNSIDFSVELLCQTSEIYIWSLHT